MGVPKFTLDDLVTRVIWPLTPYMVKKLHTFSSAEPKNNPKAYDLKT